MNKHCYRVILNKKLNRFVVVSELAKTEGKASQNDLVKRPTLLSKIMGKFAGTLNAINFSLFLALGLVYMPATLAETLIIKADHQAPKNQQPIIIKTANGLPQVNIQTPNQKGLSHNRYAKFDVDKKGAILNNSRKHSKTTLAGYVQGNPYLARGEAKLILNEVNSNDPSLLKGYVEVAGKKADVIIANPSGIHCQGCGVLNSNRVTFSTGKAQIKQGDISGFKVAKGKIVVSGEGLDNHQVDYTEILAKRTEIKSKIWGKKKITVITGEQEIQRLNAGKNKEKSLQIIHTANRKTNQTEQKQYSVDVAELGGMYANRIHLIGTEQGLGVRNSGQIGAGVGEVAIDEQGNIVNTGLIQGEQQVKLKAKGNIHNQGKINSQTQDVQLTNKGHIKQQGSIVAYKGNVHLHSEQNIQQQGETLAHKNIDYQGQNIQASTSSVLASGVNFSKTKQGEQRQLASTDGDQKTDLHLSAQQNAILQGKNFSAGKLDVHAQSVNLNHSQNSASQINILASQGDVQANNAQIGAKKQLNIQTPTTLATEHSQLQAEKITTQQQNLKNSHGIWQQTGKEDFVLKAQHLENQSGSISTQGDFQLQGQTVENTQGTLLSGQDFDLHVAQDLSNQQGIIAAKKNLRINSGLLNNDQGLIQSQQALHIDTNQQALINTHTQNKGILALGELTIDSGNLENQQGEIQAKENVTLNTAELNNDQGLIQSQQALKIQSGSIQNTNGLLFANKNNVLNIEQGTLNNQQQGKIQALAGLRINAKTLQNQGGFIQAAQNSTLNVAHINNQKVTEQGSLIEGGKTLAIQTENLNNQGTVATTTTPSQGLNAAHISIQGNTIENDQGGIYASDSANLQVNKLLNNTAGELLAIQQITVGNPQQQLQINNQQGKIEAGKKITLNSKNLDTDGGINTQGNLTINLQDDFTLTSAFGVGGDMNLHTAGHFTNHSQQISGGDLSISGQSIDNAKNAELIAGDTTTLSSQSLTNRGLIDGSKTHILADNINNLGTGRIYGDHLGIKAETLNNLAETTEETKAATIAARESLDLGIGTLTNRDHALIFSQGTLAIGGDLNASHQAIGQASFVDNGSATIEALGDGKIVAHNLLNNDLYAKTNIKKTSEYIEEHALGKDGHKYRAGVDGYYDVNNGSRDPYSYFKLYSGEKISGFGWYSWFYTQYKETPILEYSDPGKILIGGNLKLSGDKLHNKYSHLMIGKKLYLDDKTFTENVNNQNLSSGKSILINEDLTGSLIKKDKGIYRIEYKIKHHSYHYHRNRLPYSREYEPKTYHLNQVINRIGSAISGTNTEIDQKTTKSEVKLNDKTKSLHQNVIKTNDFNQTLTPIEKRQVEQYSPLNVNQATEKISKIKLPQASLYKINAQTNAHYLVETDPQFTDHKKWLSSDYMFKVLRYDHNNIQKRLGDGFYEQRMINEQINQLTGRRYLEGYHSDYDQYQALMNNGIEYAKKFNLELGIGLSAQQMKELTTDIVWLVNQNISLPDGSIQKVLVPQVYIVARNTDIDNRGAVISANQIILNSSGNIKNSGVIAGRKLSAINANNIHNVGGVISAENMFLQAQNNLENLGGKLQASEQLIGVGKNINIQSTLSESKFDPNFYRKQIDQTATVEAKNLTLYADHNITVKGANIQVEKLAHIEAKNKLDLGTIETKNKGNYTADQDNYYHLNQEKQVGNRLHLKGNTILKGNKEVVIKGSDLSSDGTVNIVSDGAINILESRQKEILSNGAKGTTGNFLSKTTTTRKHYHQHNITQGTQIDANKINIQSTNGNVNIQGSDVVAENGLTIQGKNIEIKEAANKIYAEDFHQTKKSGLLSSGGIGFTIGSRKKTTENDQAKLYAKGSQVGSLKGPVNIVAQDHYQQTASSVTSVEDDVNIQGKKVDIQAADDKYETNSKYTFEQNGLTVALNVPIVQAVQSGMQAVKSVQKVGQSKNPRINALATANAAIDIARSYESISNAVGATNALANGNIKDANVSVSITYGEQKNIQSSHIKGTEANASGVNAGGKVNIFASGDKQSNINIVGSDVSGAQGTTLIADNQVNIKAKSQTHQERSNNKFQGWNAGVAVSYGSNGFALGITAGGNYGKGYGNGDEQSWRGSRVGDKNSRTTIISKQDTNLIGSQVKGKGVTVQAKNLNIESLQDTMTYKGKQQNISGQVTVGYGASASGSFNKSKVNADYASVNTQAGIFAGDEGYQINLEGKTKLKGAAMVSSAEKSKNILNAKDFEFEHIANHSEASAESFGLSGAVSFNRDQTSQEDKELNKKYRSGREGETFEKANPNKAKDSPIKFGLNNDDIHSTDKYALAKLAGANLLNQDKQSESRANITESVISDGQFTIESQKGQQQIADIRKSKHSNHSALEKVDKDKLLAEAKHNQEVKGQFINNVAEFTDEAYRTQFIAEHRMMTFVIGEDGKPEQDPEILQTIKNEARKAGYTTTQDIDTYIQSQLDKGRNIYKLREVSDQERDNLQKVTYFEPNTKDEKQGRVIGLNGIFNNLQSAAKFAPQNYVATKDKDEKLSKRIHKDMYFVHNPESHNFLSELMVAGYHKFLEGNIAGLSNSTLQVIDLMKKYGKDDLFLGAHSRGTMTLDNALKAVNTQENQEKAILSGTTIKMVGAAANLQDADQRYKALNGNNNSIRFEGYKNDIVHEYIGGNAITHHINEKNNNFLKIIYDIFAGETSPHNCLGLGQVQCQKDGYRQKGKLIMHKEATVDSLYKTQQEKK